MTTQTFSEAWTYWLQLPKEVQSKFHHLSGEGGSAFEFFWHEIPDTLKDSSTEILTLLNGSPELGVPNHDFSHIVSDSNGGPTSPDNIILEDSSLNFKRGNDPLTGNEANMTPQEVDAAEFSLEEQADLIDATFTDDTLVTSVLEVPMENADILIAPVSDTFGAADVFEGVVDGILPGLAAYKCAEAAWNCLDESGADDVDKVGYTALAAGGGTLATVAVLANPVGAACVGIYGVYKLGELGCKLWSKYA